MNSYLLKEAASHRLLILMLVSLFLGSFCFSSEGKTESKPSAVTIPEVTVAGDRRSKQGQSAAAALAAASMLKIMCLKQMSEALEEKDKDKRDEKMNMAMLMCAQADAMAQNGKENEEGEKKMESGPDKIIVPPTFEKPNLQTQANSDEFDPNLRKTPSSKQSSDKQSSDSLAANSPIKPETAPESENNTTLSPKGTFAENKDFGSAISEKSKENSRAQDGGRVSLNEPLIGGRNPASASNSSANSLPFERPLSKDQDPNQKVNPPNFETDAGTTSPGGFDEILAKYMGGGGGGGSTNPIAAASLSSGIVDIAYGLKVSGQRTKTIFEFASEQYQKVKPAKKPSQR